MWSLLGSASSDNIIRRDMDRYVAISAAPGDQWKRSSGVNIAKPINKKHFI